MSARSTRPPISRRRTWLALTAADVAIWVIAELQHSSGSLRTVFDGVWLATLFAFIVLLVVGLVATVHTRRRPMR